MNFSSRLERITTRPVTSEALANASEVTGRVVILSSRDEKFMRGLWDLVRETHPKLDLVIDYGKDAGYLDRLRVEKDSPIADLYLSKLR